MSHFTKIKTEFKESDILIDVLKDLNYNVEERASTIRGYQGNQVNVDFKVTLKYSYPIGFVKQKDGKIEIIADWWGVKGIKKEVFVSSLKQNYSVKLIMREMSKKGYKIVEQNEQKDKSIKIVVRSW